MKVIHIRKPRPGESNIRPAKLAEARKLFGGPDVRVLTDKSIKSGREASIKVRKDNVSEFKRLFAPVPAFVSRLAAASAPGSELAAVWTMADRRIAGINADAQIRDAVLTRKHLLDAGRQSRRYSALHQEAKGVLPRIADAAKRAKAEKEINTGLPLPTNIAVHSVGEITRALADLVAWILRWCPPPPDTKPRGYPSKCSAEEGTGDGTDMSGCSVGAAPALNPKGLRTLCSWPLKWFNTCVRDQANRGTCSAFAVVAAVESRIAIKFNRWINLSEQDLYKHQKLDWNPNPFDDYFGDGYTPAISLLQQALAGYRFPFERDWDYNPSCQRDPYRIHDDNNDPDRRYERSCDAYNGGDCSETNHQAGEKIVRIERTIVEEVVSTVCGFIESIPFIGGLIGSWVCEVVTQVIETIVPEYVVTGYETTVPGSSGFHVTSAMPIWDPLEDLSAVRAHLIVGHPVVFCFTVSGSFTGTPNSGNKAGYITYDPNEEEPDHAGGHAVLMTGFVGNANLPKGVAAGAGGGYFIIKNSWGTSFGDGGYCYAPYDWVKKWGTAMTAVVDVA